MKKISISFICCVKNEINYVHELFDSVTKSTPIFLDWNLIFIDDHSDDGTYELLSKLVSKNKKVSLFTNKGHGKVLGTKTGIELASGKWIKFLDGDDYVSFNSLIYDDFNCDAFYHDYYRVNKSKQKIIHLSKSLASNPKSWKYELRSIPKAMFFAKTSLFKDLKGLDKCLFEDLYINQSIQRLAKTINKVDKCLYYYRQHDSNYYGDSFFGNPKKVKRMGKRINNMVEVLGIYFKNDKINPSLKKYSEFLHDYSFIKLFSLFLSPRLFLKAIYYFFISKINFNEN